MAGRVATRSPSRSTPRPWECSISGATVTFVAAGTCVIDANQAGNANYEAATQVQQSFDPDPARRASPSPRPLRAPRSSEAPTSPRRRRGEWQPCHLLGRPIGQWELHLSGATVTFVAVGTCVIDADQAGNANYEAASQVQQSFAVLGTQSITFTSTPPKPAVSEAPTPTASGGASGNPVTFSVDPSAKGSCSISGATVTFVAVGTCVIDADQAGNASYEAATQVQQSFAVLGTQSITFTSTPPKPAVIGGTYPTRRAAGRAATRSPSRSTPRPMGAAASRAPPSPSSPSGPASSTPTRPATPTTKRPRRSSSPSPCPRYPGHHLYLDPAPPRGRGRHLHPGLRAVGQAATRSPSRSTPRRMGAAASRCHRHLRRRRNLRHRRQPGRQRLLRGRHPGPAVLCGVASGSSPTSHFPIAVWLQNPDQTTQIESGYSSLGSAAAAEGINTFLGLYDWPSAFGMDTSSGGQGAQFQAACNAGENVIAGGDPSSNTSAESVASVDKIAAGETQAGTGTPCTKYLVGYNWDDEPAECSTNVAAQVAAIHAEDPTRPTVDNMASWVTWDASGCDSTANAAFAAPSYPSSDDYHNTDAWNTDNCEAAAHVSTSPWADCSWLYGYQGAVQTSLAGGKPTWEYIETGTDELGFSSQNGSSCNTTTNACSNGNEYNATAPQVNADAWDAILNGVSGIEWFCHGTAQGQNLSDSDCLGGNGSASNAIFSNLQYIDGTDPELRPRALERHRGLVLHAAGHRLRPSTTPCRPRARGATCP